MYRIDKVANQVIPLKPAGFAELKFREREHLQVWIEKHPEILGEDLLIIQKEFDGWDGTRERLDLLAIDKRGRLVIIENKLDDSGRDVVWQAMKYAAYCSTLTRAQIINIYDRYPGRDKSSTAEESLLDFLERGSVEELIINPGNSQRIILTAANFRSEVTATCLWLINNDISIHCVQVRAYRDREALYLQAERIIPPPASEDFMIRAGSKEKSESIGIDQASDWMLIRKKFFDELLTKLTGSAAETYQNRTPNMDHWLSGASGTSSITFHFTFLKDQVRIDLGISRGTKAENKWYFDRFLEQQASIEAGISEKVRWLRLEDRKSSRIEVEKHLNMSDQENWPEAFEWMNKLMNEFIKTLKPIIADLVIKASIEDASSYDWSKTHVTSED